MTPIPPLLASRPEDPDHEKIIDMDADMPFNVTKEEKNAAIYPPLPALQATPSVASSGSSDQQKHKALTRVVRFFKKNTKIAVETRIGIDHIKAKLGNEKAQTHLGVFQKKDTLVYAGPSVYKARYQGRKGWVHLSPTTVSFSHENEMGPERNKVFEFLIDDIVHLKRAQTFVSSLAETAADWSCDKILLGALEITTQRDGEEKLWNITGVPERDQLFNRLVAMGQQRWLNF